MFSFFKKSHEECPCVKQRRQVIFNKLYDILVKLDTKDIHTLTENTDMLGSVAKQLFHDYRPRPLGQEED